MAKINITQEQVCLCMSDVYRTSQRGILAKRTGVSLCTVTVALQASHQLIQVCHLWPLQRSATLAESDYEAADALQC